MKNMEFDKYVNKPIVKKGKKLTEENIESVRDYINENGGESKTVTNKSSNETALYIVTLEGEMKAPIGNVVMQGIQNEFWSIDPDIFDKTYDVFNEEVDES